MPKKEFTVAFIKERETKGAVRYQEVDKDGTEVYIGDGAKIGTLYVRKTAVDGLMPNALGVTVTYNE